MADATEDEDTTEVEAQAMVDAELIRVTGKGARFWVRAGWAMLAAIAIAVVAMVVFYGDADDRNAGSFVLFAAIVLLLFGAAIALTLPENLRARAEAGEQPTLNRSAVLATLALFLASVVVITAVRVLLF